MRAGVSNGSSSSGARQVHVGGGGGGGSSRGYTPGVSGASTVGHGAGVCCARLVQVH